jgi:large subunit ribosomal protein L3
MTQVFRQDGSVAAGTVIQAGPVTVTQVKTKETDGYRALQIGFGEKKAKNTPKAQQGHFKKAGETMFRVAREERLADVAEVPEVGTTRALTELVSVGDTITVSGNTKGKGFQGVVKRHNFAGGPRTHGQKHTERSPGSIGGGLRNRVPKGMKMAGRTGDRRVTVKNLTVLAIDEEKQQLVVSGAVPGRRGTLLEIRTREAAQQTA